MKKTAILLERLAALIHQSVRDDAVRHGLQPIHVQVLSYLARANAYSDIPIAIAEYFGITRGTVSQSLKVLERKGLLERRPDERHGRRIHLQVTSAGREVLDDGWAGRIEMALQLVSESPDDLEQALRSLLTGLQRVNQQRPFGVCRHCVHFLAEAGGQRCGLTGEPLADRQIELICREWTDPTGTVTKKEKA